MEGGSTLSSRRRSLASLVIFDTEATGSPTNPRKRQKITELCLLCIQTNEIDTKQTPRVINKLQLCVNPECRIPPEINRVTGLYNDHLEHMPTFREVASLITSFLACQPKPLCIIAHNGNGFDFPLLLREMQAAGHSVPEDPDILCADSLEAFRMLDGLPPVPEWLLKRQAEERERAAMAAAVQVTSGEENGVDPFKLTLPSTQLRGGQCEPKRVNVSGGHPCLAGTAEGSAVDTFIGTSGKEETINRKEDMDGRSQVGATHPLPSTSYSHCGSKVGNNVMGSHGNNGCNQTVHTMDDTHTNRKTGQRRPHTEPGASTSVVDTHVESSGDRCIQLSNDPCIQLKTEQTEITSSSAAKVQRLESMASVHDGLSQVNAVDSQLTEAYSFSSQPSVTDSQLNEAYEALEDNGGLSLSQGREDVVSLQQMINETTPPRSTCIGLSTAHNVAAQFVKRGQPVYVSQEREKVSRKLFIGDDNCAVSDNKTEEHSALVGPTMLFVAPSADECFNNSAEIDVIPLKPDQVVSLAPETLTSRDGDNNASAVLGNSNNTDCSKTTAATSCVPLTFLNTAAVTSTSTEMLINQDAQQMHAASSSAHLESRNGVQTIGASNQATKTPKVSYKLGEIHRRMYGRLPAVAHTAEDDCKTLLRIICGRYKEFLEWANEHAVPLHSIKP